MHSVYKNDYFFTKMFVDLYLVLIRSFPGSFYHPAIFGTPSDYIKKNVGDFVGIKYPQNRRIFSEIWSEGVPKISG